MPRRSLLTEAQRQRFWLPPTDERDLVCHYTLAPEDLALANQRRRDSNRLGFALLLCYLRHPGRVLEAGERPPEPMLRFVAMQLGVDAEAIATYAERDETRREHLSELQRALGLQPFTTRSYRDLSAWLLPVALNTGSGPVLVATLLEEMRRRRIILPPVAVSERLCSEVRLRAEREVFRTLTRNLQAESLDRLDGLLSQRPDAGSQSWLAWLRQPANAAKRKSLLAVLSKLEHVRSLGLDATLGRTLHHNRLKQVAREGMQSTAQHLGDLEPLRRHATLTAVVLELEALLTDDAIDLFSRLVGAIFRESERRHVSRFHASGRAINEKVRLYAQLGRALLAARESGANPLVAVDQAIGWERLAATVQEAESLAPSEAFDPLDLLDEQYAAVRRYAPSLLAALEFRAAAPAASLLRAVEALRDTYAAGRRTLQADVPVDFVRPRWLPLVFRDGAIDRRFYELCTLSELRDRLRAGDVWVVGSRQYRDFEDYLVPVADYAELRDRRALPVAVDPAFRTFLAERRQMLEEQFSRVARKAAAGELPDVVLRDGELSISPLRKAVPDEAEDLARRAYALLPRVKITDLLAEVDAWTGFTDRFTHLRSGLPAADKHVLLTAVLADGINLGLSRMAEACRAVGLRQLTWTADWHIRDESYSQALAQLIDFHHKLPFSRFWGEGETSSSDGQFHRAGGTGEAAGVINARYGSEPGVMFYTHLSDQFGPYHVKVIAATASEAPHVLDGLLYHESTLTIREHYTDTAGATDHVFGLCQLLGFRFAPRIRDLKDRRLYTLGKPSAWPTLERLVAGTLDVRHMEAHWDDVLRLATSIKTGTVTASAMLRKLAAYPRQNGLAVALRELGRLERTLFTLDWLQDAELRRRSTVGLNKGEARNALGRAVFFNRLGEMRDRSYENQRYRASGLNLVVAAIIVWNTVYLERAIQTLRAQGQSVLDEHLQHLTPLGWEHINLTGDYVWNPSPPPRLQELRPLRSPASILVSP